jgi:hypothetical protein
MVLGASGWRLAFSCIHTCSASLYCASTVARGDVLLVKPDAPLASDVDSTGCARA